MPAYNVQTPSVSISVPVPGPVQPAPRPKAAPPPKPAPAPVAPVVAPRPEPVARAFVFPYAPPKPDRYGRRPLTVRRYALDDPSPHPEHMSQFGVVNPEHLTSDVRHLAQQVIGPTWQEQDAHRRAVRAWHERYEPTGWVEGDEPEPEPLRQPRWDLAPILADALEDAGVGDQKFLADLRSGPQGYGNNPGSTRAQWGNNPNVIHTLAHGDPAEIQSNWDHHLAMMGRRRQAEEATRQAAERLAAAHQKVVGPRIAHLEARAKEASRRRAVSESYWSRVRAGALSELGFVTVRIGGHPDRGMRGTPPPGEVWIRPATSGRWGKSRMVKKGRPLTAEELEAMTANPQPTQMRRLFRRRLVLA